MKRIISILFMVITGLVCCVDVNAQQLPDGYKKFLGVWNCEPPIGGFGNIKVIESDGKLVVRIKYEGEIITCKDAELKNGKLYFSFAGVHKWGKWTVKNGEIITERGGTNGPVSRIYDSFHYGNKIANEEQQVWYLYLSENADGDMDLFYDNGIYYLKNNIVLFEQASISYMHYRKYTNW